MAESGDWVFLLQNNDITSILVTEKPVVGDICNVQVQLRFGTAKTSSAARC
jgi:hypothetical protein